MSKNGLPYYKAYPRDFIEGTIGMPFEVKGAYRLVLDLIYMQNGALPDDARYISGLLGCSVKKWNLLRAELLRRGKLGVSGEFLTNLRADKELKSLAKFQDKQSQNATASSKNNDLEKVWLNHPDTEPESEPECMDDDDDRRGPISSSWRDDLLAAIGVPSDGDSLIGSESDMALAGRWETDLKLDRETILKVMAETASRKRDGPPRSFKYFTKAMQHMAGALQQPPLKPMESADEPDRNHQRRQYRANASRPNRFENLASGFARAVSARQSRGDQDLESDQDAFDAAE